MKWRSRRYKESADGIEPGKLYHPFDAAKLVSERASGKFDETFEVAIRLGVDPRRADQMIRGTIMLPGGTGKEVRVAVFAIGDKAVEAEKAGADFVGGEDMVAKVQGGWTDFDVAIATPDVMSLVGRLGKILGPRGLMPNPKSGTVTFDIEKAVSDVKGGKVEYRVDKQANVHLVVGKVSFSLDSIMDNYAAVLEELIRARPAAVKGRYIKSITFSSTMGPGVSVDTTVTRGFIPEAAAC
ncbi:MAG: 50S ribosomal protein L1 [Candidatus Anoxymicrobium japonicum]|uniref:Large ribosomal subunit protein uL1 n=1 Tax=Candidatus Anoxymicrobium japonicum TaxID=2013648 RepID=A0A2N3G5E1_9ACTN|nr:MAG: 50S ribosomal protein L1 [Candidatus Anoxymicrobium japonicum]